MKRLPDAIRNLNKLHAKAIAELHPELRARVEAVLFDCGYKFKIWDGFRDEESQMRAYRSGFSNAKFGQSPHNYTPALAADLVLNPAVVNCNPRRDDPEWPDLWDPDHPAWEELELLSVRHHLGRVNLRPDVRDLPHVELPGWRDLAGI